MESDKALSIRSYANAVIVPRMRKRKRMREQGLFADGVQVPWSTSEKVRLPHAPESVSLDLRGLAVRDMDEEVVFIGTLWCMWGHLITDFAAHLWPLLSLDRRLRVAYAVGSPKQALPENFRQLLSALGAPSDRLIEVREPMRFRKVHFGDPSFWHEGGKVCMTAEYGRTIDAVRSGVLSGGGRSVPPRRKVYLTRTGLVGGRKDFGERQIEDAYRRAGFEVVAPERISFVEMVRLFAETAVLATTEGSVSHNALFLPKGARLEVLRKADFGNDYQDGINELRALDVTCLNVSKGDCLAVPKEFFRGPFLIGVTPDLARHLGCEPEDVPFAERMRCALCRARTWLKAHRI